MPATICLQFPAEHKKRRPGIGPTGVAEEGAVRKHRKLLPRIMVILAVIVKIIIERR
jgi:hypothetical protein